MDTIIYCGRDFHYLYAKNTTEVLHN